MVSKSKNETIDYDEQGAKSTLRVYKDENYASFKIVTYTKFVNVYYIKQLI